MSLKFKVLRNQLLNSINKIHHLLGDSTGLPNLTTNLIMLIKAMFRTLVRKKGVCL